MNEALLSVIWHLKIYDSFKLTAVSGEEIIVINPGVKNLDQGPDFTMARIKINDQVWVGNIEIHVNNSDWDLHKHNSDPRYSGIILHVVFNYDKTCSVKAPVLELRPYLNNKSLTLAKRLINSTQKIPCASLFVLCDAEVRNQWLKQNALKRLERKIAELEKKRFKQNCLKNILIYQYCRFMGFKKNSGFDWLAEHIDFEIIDAIHGNVLLLEAYLFGISGLLNGSPNDDYHLNLMNHFEDIKSKFKIIPLNIQWNYLRMRPANFPERRIAQFSQFIRLLKGCDKNGMTPEDFMEILKKIILNDYWNKHYRFGLLAPTASAKLSTSTMSILLINVFWPWYFLCNANRSNNDLVDDYCNSLNGIKPERNKIISLYRSLGFMPESALITQGLLELNSIYCKAKRCMECSIGLHSLKS
jgi:hypothetical protein